VNYRRWIFIAILLFGIGLTAGLITPTSIASFISEDINATLKEISSNVVPFSVLTVIFIFIKNASALLISFAFSPILCLLPILALILNGWVIAFVSNIVLQEKSLSFLLAGLLPHGIFELPAFIIGGALLWQRRPLGYVGGTGLLFLLSMLFVGLIAILLLQPVLTDTPLPVTDIMVLLVMGSPCFIAFALFLRGIAAKGE